MNKIEKELKRMELLAQMVEKVDLILEKVEEISERIDSKKVKKVDGPKKK